MEANRRVVIVTGASSGIGRATAEELARGGANLVLAARRANMLEDLAAQLSSDTCQAIAVATDVRLESDIAAMVRTAMDSFGRVDALVNAAGVGAFGPIGTLSAADLDHGWAVNARGAVLAARQVAPIMAAQRAGTIVNVGSVSCKRGWAGGTAYVASKFALRGATECLRAELRPHGVRVLLICPDLTDTGFFSASGIALKGDEALLRPEEVAATIRFALDLPHGAELTELDLIPSVRR